MYCKRLLLEHQCYSMILTHPWHRLNLCWGYFLSLFHSGFSWICCAFLSAAMSESLYSCNSKVKFHDLWPYQREHFSLVGGTRLLLLSMLIEFLCSLIKRIEFASAVGCYMASWVCTHLHKHAHALSNTQSFTSMCTPIHPSWQLVNCQGVNWKWWCNCIRVLIYPGLLFIYLAVDFKAALIVWVRQDMLGIDRLDVSPDSDQTTCRLFSYTLQITCTVMKSNKALNIFKAEYLILIKKKRL